MVVAMIIYVWLTVYIYDSVNIECEVEVVVTLTGKESYEGTMVEVAVKHEDGEDYQPGSRRTLANPDGMANITITLTKTGRYTLTARFLDDSHSAPVTKELELVSDDDGGTKQIEMKLRWKP